MRWDNPEYQRISSATRHGDEIAVVFDDGFSASVKTKYLVSPNTGKIDWSKMKFNRHELMVRSSDNEEIVISWLTIRTLTDGEFGRHLAVAAEEEARQIGLRIKELRQSRGISGKDLAKRSGITPQSLSRIENGRHDVVFTTLQRILAAMGFSLQDLSPASGWPRTLSLLLSYLDKLGISKELAKKRFVPSKREGVPRESQIAVAANAVSRIYGWSIGSILEGRYLTMDLQPVGQGLYKKYGRTQEIRANAYALFAHWLALLALAATPSLRRRSIPNDPGAVRRQVQATHKELSFGSLLSYLWEKGIAVLPLSDPGVFHGACWEIEGRIVIVIKQGTRSQARWLFDLAHELGHVLRHLSKENPIIIEPESITFSSANDVEADEEEASEFAEQLILGGKAEEATALCVERAQGRMRQLKSAVIAVAQEVGLPVDSLANYVAFRLSLQGQNWWGAANNLQVTTPSPLEIARREFTRRVDLDRLTPEDRTIVLRALDAVE